MTRRILLLGGTAEARDLALALARHTDVEVVSSLAGLVTRPLQPDGEVQVGGLGGVEGLVGWIREQDVAALVDATHPFATSVTDQATVAAMLTRTPVIRLSRPAWEPTPGDRWHLVSDTREAVRAARLLGDRVFLTIGRRDVGAFAHERGWFLIRATETPTDLPARHEVLLSQGPFTLESERALMRAHGIEVLVTRNSGGSTSETKLVAARAESIPVVMVERPPHPAGLHVVHDVAGVLSWLDEVLRQSDG